MPKSTIRRTSLQPAFEPFDLLESSPVMPPVQTNGYHSETLADEETNSCNGHHDEMNGAKVNGAAINGEAVNGEAVNGLDSDLADLAAAKVAFAAEPISELPIAAAPTINISNQNDTAGQNGHAKLNGHAESNGAMIAVPADLPLESPASPVVSAAPPIVGDELIEPAAEPFMEAPSTDDSAPMSVTREAHPASGSLFVPYLVTEIRELRNRRQRNRSWWRRIFG